MATIENAKSGKKFDNAEDVAELVSNIRSKEDSLETLILECNSYGIEPAREIGSSLEMCHGLKHLLLNDMFTSRLKTEIPDALRFIFGGVMASQAQLITLDLSDNAIGPVTMPQLVPFLQSHHCSTLKKLRLNNCGLGIKGGNMLSTVLPNLENLTELIVGRNRLEIDGVRDISVSLSKLCHLEVVELPQNGTKAAGVEALVEALKVNTKLRVLNLNDNVLKNMEQKLAEVISSLQHLEILNFGDCLLKTNGCITVMSAIQSICEQFGKCHLQEIILNGNEIGKGAGPTIISTIETILANRDTQQSFAPPLKIDLSCNNLGESLVEDLREKFAGNLVNLIVEDDEGSGDEEDGNEDTSYQQEDEEEKDVEENNRNNESTTLIGGDEREHFDVEQLSAEIDTKYKDFNSLGSRFVECSLNGYRPSSGTLSDRCLAETEAIIKVGQKRCSSNINGGGDDSNFVLLNPILVSSGLLKGEDKRQNELLRKQDLHGPLLALMNSINHFNSDQKKCLKFFIQDRIADSMYDNIRNDIFKQLYSF